MAETETPEPPAAAPKPEPTKRTWREWLIWRGFTHPFTWFVFFFVMGGWAISAYVLAVYGDGHESPDTMGSTISRYSICPSIDAVDEAEITAEPATWTKKGGGWPDIAVVRSECIGPPESGEAQWRGENDIVVDWTPLREHHGSTISRPVGGPIDRAVVYLKPRWSRKDCVIPHEGGHVRGLADATAATSIMHEDCGSSWAYVQFSAYAPSTNTNEAL